MLKPLSTNDGQNQKGHVYILAAFMQPVVFAMSPGWGQVITAMVVFLGLAFLSYKTVGNIPPEQAKDITDLLETDTVQDVLREGRE